VCPARRSTCTSCRLSMSIILPSPETESPTIVWPDRATGRWPEFPERRWSEFSEPAAAGVQTVLHRVAPWP
jgi:hypothetical protein